MQLRASHVTPHCGWSPTHLLHLTMLGTQLGLPKRGGDLRPLLLLLWPCLSVDGSWGDGSPLSGKPGVMHTMPSIP